jgi:shikimate kinase
MKILICGFMGAGKSHWLKDLERTAGQSQFVFLDLDHEIAKFLKISPLILGEWIAQNGWPLFRKIEQEQIGHFMTSQLVGVLCLGGGALNHEVQKMLENNKNVKMVFLNTPFEICFERITGDGNRPLATLKKEELYKLYEERLTGYFKANLILEETERKEIEGIHALVHTLYGPK